MKHGKNPTLKQKILIRQLGWNPDNWLVVKITPMELLIEHRDTGRHKEYIFKDGAWYEDAVRKSQKLSRLIVDFYREGR